MVLPVFPNGAESLVKKHLSQKIFTRLAPLKTRSGFTLAKAIQSGIKNPDSAIGIYAGDAESYETFAPIFDPVIADYHGVSTHDHRTENIAAPAPLDPEGRYILSTRIRVARNLNNFSFPCHINLARRRTLEKKIITALDCLTGDLKGRYLSVEQAGRPLFEKGDRFQDAAGINSDFPECRGHFVSADNRLQIWVNEEDHLRIISLESSGDIASVFNRLDRALTALNTSLDFARDRRLGYLTSCPTNIGTAMRAGVHICLENLAQKKPLLQKIAQTHNLQIRGTRGEKTRVEHSVFDISNRQRLGISASRIIETLHQGLRALLVAEESF